MYFSTNSPDPDIELVTTAGIGKNGALCVLQRSIRPQVSVYLDLCVLQISIRPQVSVCLDLCLL